MLKLLTPTASPAVALPILRWSIAVFMLVWSVDKLLMPEDFIGLFQNFYGATFGVGVILAIGAVQTALIVAFALGLYRTITYGLMLVMNAVTVLVSLPQILDPYGGGANQLFFASVPVLGACLLLFLLRDQDTKLVIKR